MPAAAGSAYAGSWPTASSTCFLDDETSSRLMERLGMRREVHAVAESLHRSGRWLDTVAHAILADEWADQT